MDVRIEGNPGTGNTFQEIHIGHVETYAPAATTVINNHYSDRKPPHTPADTVSQDIDKIQCRGEIMQYVSNLKEKDYVAPAWKNRYETLWHSILDIPEVAAAIYKVGKQKDTTFNRNLVANIIYIMCKSGVISEQNATKLTEALEGNKEHSVRAQLGKLPDDAGIARKIKQQLEL